ncbi:thioesterase II family protein [Streptomyces sp. NPDC088116]|uniref:thioesterase II family protein n=1 Tax=Streptomyces sp. NPDC088116 TaxID=3365825 RepID=UPI00380E78CC
MSSTAIPDPGGAGSWLRRHRPRSAPRVRLVCLPHAGGSASAYHGWAAALPADVELVALQYPGRQDRFGEPCVEGMAEMADAVTAALLPLTDRPIALFGHSMGAAVAYEVALRLEGRHQAGPRHLFVSAQVAPSRWNRGEDLHLLDDASMVAGVGGLGGMDERVLTDPDLLPLSLPSLRADLRIIETYRPSHRQRVRAPVTAYSGDSDAGVPVADLAAWSELTSTQFALRIFEGGHFYLLRQQRELLADITARLSVVRNAVRSGVDSAKRGE